ncbi:MAG: PIN domain-containing protein [Rubrobacter sp.]|nr:PIN domain-containing protein [Rubrobacter sp.]
MLIVDTSGLLAAIDSDQSQHERSREVLETREGPFLLSPFALAELDYLLATRVGQRQQLSLLAEVGRGAFRLESFSNSDIKAAVSVLERYADLQLGLADASNVVIADRSGTTDILTLDERHFRTVVGDSGDPFRLLPADL